jgi:hypothetical protein
MSSVCPQLLVLDYYEVREWQAWYPHITIASLAHAFLMSPPEIRQLLCWLLLLKVSLLEHVMHWSN